MRIRKWGKERLYEKGVKRREGNSRKIEKERKIQRRDREKRQREGTL